VKENKYKSYTSIGTKYSKKYQKRSWPTSSLTIYSSLLTIVNTTDDDCKQQVPSVALRLQQLWSNAYCSYFVFETRTSPRAASGEDVNASTESAMPTS